MSIDSLPRVSQSQISEMQKAADKMMKANNVAVEEPQVEEQVQNNSLETEEAAVSVTAAAESEAPEETAEQPVPVSAPPPPKPRAYSKEENMALLRERAKKAEQEREELARQLQAYQAKISPTQTQQETVEELSMAPDELAEGKHIAKLQKKIKSLEDKMQQSAQYSTSAAAEARLRTTYPDFDKVVSQSNIAALSEMFPDVAKTIGESNDLYSKAVTAYTVIKNLGIYTDDFKQEKAVAAVNAAKPRPLTSISPQQGDTPLSRANAFANGLTDDLRKSLQKEMFEAMKNR